MSDTFVIVFYDCAFERVEKFDTPLLARAWQYGFKAGAHMFAGYVSTYLMPDDLDEEEMRVAEPAGEVEKALAAVRR